MTVETDFRGVLAGAAGVTSLVGTRIAQNAVPQGGAYPLVTFVVDHQRELRLDNTLAAEQCTVSVQCWAETPAAASTVADAVEAALAASATALAHDATVIARAGAFDEEMGLDAEQITVEWWVKA